MTATTLKIPLNRVDIPEPSVQLGDVGRQLWRDVLVEFGNWNVAELRTLNLACLAFQEAAAITTALADDGLTFKEKRQLRADRNAASTTWRQQMRELNLSAQPADSRPGRIPGRYRA